MTPSTFRNRLVAFGFIVAIGCGARWQAGPSSAVPPERVARALGDSNARGELLPGDIPELPPPEHVRPCCAFGTDLRVSVGDLPVPLFSLGNILEPDQIGHHRYGPNEGRVESEKDGLVYTCRGGWADTAHIRDSADHTLYFATRIAKALPGPLEFEYPGDGAQRTFRIAAIEPALVERYGRMQIATVLAEWMAFEISLWHESATWFGWQSIAGFSEQPSAFSLEDLYSNVIGIRIAAAILEDGSFRSQEDYDRVMDAWIVETLHQLEPLSKEQSVAVMHALDGRWWDSSYRLPDPHLVRRRAFETEMPLRPWRLEDAYGDEPLPSDVADLCHAARPRTLEVRSRIGSIEAAEVVSIEWRPEDWAEETLPFPRPDHVIHAADLPALMTAAHRGLEEMLGEGFDRPRAPRTPPGAAEGL
jgi:Protein of unknown function (DUF4056)